MSTEEVKQKKEKKVKVDTEVEVVGDGGVKKEKKDKKRKDREEEEVKPAEVSSSGEIIGETKEQRKARKKAKKEAKKADLESQVIAPTPATGVKEESKEERKARRRAEKLAKELEDPAAPSTKIEEPAPAIPADEVALKKSKQQRKEAGAHKWTQEASEASQAMQARAEKSPIYQDESLSDMAKKGLYYCELHAASQVELQAPEYRWKFNKARQGWLMRNVWNDTEVPEVYFDRVVAYLKTLPGSARKGMIETAKKHATAIAKPEPKPEGQSEAEAEVGGDEKEEEGEKEEGEGEKEAGSGGEVAVEMRRDRAQRILKALGAR